MLAESVVLDKTSEAQQSARTELRESFLMAIKRLQGVPCNILTYEKTTLQGTFAALNPDNQDMLVQNLQTPANICINSALLRSSDILSVQFDFPGQVSSFYNT